MATLRVGPVIYSTATLRVGPVIPEHMFLQETGNGRWPCQAFDLLRHT